jgi:lipoprotein-anchoring transpeptidase ErfK/SrfK
MSSGNFSAAVVGNDFVIRTPKFQNTIKKTPVEAKTIEVKQVPQEGFNLQLEEPIATTTYKPNVWSKVKISHKYLTTSIFFILLTTVGIQIISPYWYNNLIAKISAISSVNAKVPPQKIDNKLGPLHLILPMSVLSSKLKAITSQNAQLTVGSKTINIPSTTINSWLNINTVKQKKLSYIEVNPSAIKSSITQLADQSVVAPVNSITIAEGGVSTTILPGSNGTALANPTELANQSNNVANNLLSGKGFQINAPLVTVPSQAGSIASLGKVLDVNVTTKRMYAYDSGQLVNSFLVTAGAPATPTPIGEFHIWDKLTEQDMTGYNPNGTKYNQPNVQWINYFDHSGDAVHGNYWRPASYFGNINSSHGCVGVQDTDAEWIYNWAPIGTTVITHA